MSNLVENNNIVYALDKKNNNIKSYLNQRLINTDSKYNNSNESLSSKEDIIKLFKKHADDNSAFNVANMLPGDSETRYYNVQVSYSDDITVRFRADIKKESKKLSEVMKCKVVLLNNNTVLYDGLMKDMPESINYDISSMSKDHQNEELHYSITSYIGTNIGNEYQNTSLSANFKWWVLEEDNLDKPSTDKPSTDKPSTDKPSTDKPSTDKNPITGETFDIYLWSVLGIVSIVALTITRKLRKEDKSNEI